MEESQREIIAIHTLSRDIYNTTGELITGNNAMMNGAYNRFYPFIKTYLETVERDLDLAAAKLPADLHFDVTRREILRYIETQRAVFINSEDDTLAKDELVVKLRRVNNWVNLCGKESELLNNTLESVQSRFQQSVLSQEKERVFTGVVVGLALLLNFILACLLANYFHRHIAKRIGILVKMASRLAAHQPIDDKIEGRDELSDLAVELVRVSSELAQVAEYRRSLMQMMAHDVRSPLMGASVSVELLEASRAESLSLEGARLLGGAREAVNVCLTLVNDLLLLESLENRELKPDLDVHDARDLVADAFVKIDEQARQKSVAMENNAGRELVNLDYDQISIVMQRMLLSAINRSPQRSTVSVTSKSQGDCLLIFVRDSGSPLEGAAGDQLFDKLFQASRQSDCILPGLGLAIARPILDNLGGEIGAEGNTLWLKLRLHTSESLPSLRENI
jgi:signal transduction histidine kinase